MPNLWYYEHSGQQVGPISSQILKQLASAGQIKPTDLIWREGTNEKVPASRATGLFPPATPTVAATQKPLLAGTPLKPVADDEPPPLPTPVEDEPPPLPTCDAPDPNTADATASSTEGDTEAQGVILLISPLIGMATGFLMFLVFGGFWSMTLFGAIAGVIVAVVMNIYQCFQVMNVFDLGRLVGSVLGTLFILMLLGIAGRGEHPKVQAFRAVVEMYQHSPNEYANNAGREAYVKRLEAAQKEFSDIEFDPKKNRKEAITIIELYRKNIENRYKGQLYNQLDDTIGDVHMQLIE